MDRAARGEAGRQRPPKRSARAAAVEATRTRFQSWRTTDAEEVERRRLRVGAEAPEVVTLERSRPVFGTFLVRSRTGSGYEVEIRSLSAAENSCACPDYRINRLGTCKHIEAVLAGLRKTDRQRFEAAARAGSPRVEIFVQRAGEPRLQVRWPARSRRESRLRRLLDPYFSADGTALDDPLVTVPVIREALAGASAADRRKVRISRHIDPWLEARAQQAARAQARARFLEDVAAGKRSLDLVRHPLYPYQREGMLHLAFTERALLGDEMGLGKTVQAVAACELLRRLHGVERVLVISPASLKAEWEEQIEKFSGLPARVVQGGRPQRLHQYQQPAFFYLTNYEQIMRDGDDVQRLVAPDVIILDEAQRIKNWQTKTAQVVKRLASRFAFVLTGTPLENRIDEVYSIVQFLDPELFGPLFRFNREFYELDERGRPIGYRNLDELHRRLRAVLLRRRKEDVEEELPRRMVNNYFVAMDGEQRARYSDYESYVGGLVAKAKRRPLTKEEWDKLQKWLACMRMLCDTPYILDPDCRISPKLRELEPILEELVDDADRKILIFSEWERMLELVRELAARMGLGYAWHTGSVPQPQRRKQIRRFKDDADCRLFLSTDAGSVGLNLQAANVVINLDLPWNPARLEQRIARAWRKHQTRAVNVINLVCEESIEHRMLELLGRKQALADGVLDGRGELKAMALPSGRAGLLQRMETLLGVPEGGAPALAAASAPADGDAVTRFRAEAIAHLHDALELLEVRENGAQGRVVLAVVGREPERARALLQQAAAERLGAPSVAVEVLDRATYESIGRLARLGLLTLAGHDAQTLHRSPALPALRAEPRAEWVAQASKLVNAAERSKRMATVLIDGGFEQEALAPLRAAMENVLRAQAWLQGERDMGSQEAVPWNYVENRLVASGGLPRAVLTVAPLLREPPPQVEAAGLRAWQDTVEAALGRTKESMGVAASG